MDFLKKIKIMSKYKSLGHVFFVILIIYSIYYYLPRVLYIDSAYQVFNLINTGTFAINIERYSMVFSQLIPLLFIKLGFGLKAVVIAYSVSFILLAYFIWWLCAYKFKNIAASIAVLFSVFLMRETFVHCISETFQAIFFAALFYAWINFKTNFKNKIIEKSIFLVVAFALILLNYYLHPVTIFMIGFALGFTMLHCKNGLKNIWLYIIFVFMGLWYLKGFIFVDPNSYNAGFFGELKNFKILIPHFFGLYSTQFFFTWFNNLYIFVTIPFVALVVYYIWKKKYLKLLFFILFIVIFMVITCIIYNKGDADWAMERTFLPLAFIIGLAFASDIIEQWNKAKAWVFLYLIVVMVISFYSIRKSTWKFQGRLRYLEKVVNEAAINGHQKFYIESSKLNSYITMVTWGTSIETLIYTSIKTPEHPKTLFIYKQTPPIDMQNQSPELFLAVPWHPVWDYQSLNLRYFKLKKAEYHEIMKAY